MQKEKVREEKKRERMLFNHTKKPGIIRITIEKKKAAGGENSLRGFPPSSATSAHQRSGAVADIRG